MTDFQWTSTMRLALYCCLMFGGAMLAAAAPIWLRLSSRLLKICSIVGAGILIGTAFIVIIPEAVEALVTASEMDHTVDVSKHIGMPLVLGFLVMLVIDQVSADHSRPTTSQSRSSSDSSSGHQVETGGVHRPSEACVSSPTHTDSPTGSNIRPKSSTTTTTTGLLIHAAADGLALGSAASADSKASLQMVVFLAIFLHKAPTSFGLATFLLGTKPVSRSHVWTHVIIFAAAAPLTAMLTYASLALFNSSHADSGQFEASSMKTTGIALLFSAGTFVYVAAVHVLPQTVAKSTDFSLRSTRRISSRSKLHHSAMSWPELLCLILSALAPAAIHFVDV